MGSPVMAIRVAIFVVGVALLIAAPLTEQHQIPQYGYSGPTGPQKWGSLSPYFSTCSAGRRQSPVNIVKKEVVYNPKLRVLTRAYSVANATLVNYGFAIGMQYGKGAGVLMVDGKNYTLKQMHWHSPSEHIIDGVRYPAELQVIHKADNGNISVVAILYQYGDPDPLLDQIKDKLDELAKETCGADEEAHIPIGEMRPKHLKRNTRKYFRYIGSFTSPPCSEKVIWNILGKVRDISKEQVEALKAPLGEVFKTNSRPTQPLNGRKIELYDEMHKS